MAETVCLDPRYSTTRRLKKIPYSLKDSNKSLAKLVSSTSRQHKIEGGLRTKGYFKQTDEDKPLLSIITVVYNGEKHLEKTIQSALDQDYDNVEYIIIDGGSRDGSTDIIKKYEDAIDYWVSEADRGIYDAMNKGIVLASGDWIYFLNAGDFFYEDSVIQLVFSSRIDKGTGIIYGDAMKLFPKDRVVWSESRELSTIKCDPPFMHQCVFTKRHLAVHNLFDTEYRICADYDFFYKMYIKNIRFQKLNQTISYYDMNGISSNFISTYKEIRAIQQKYSNGKAPCITRTRLFVIAWKELVKKLLPQQWVDDIRIGLARRRR